MDTVSVWYHIFSRNHTWCPGDHEFGTGRIIVVSNQLLSTLMVNSVVGIAAISQTGGCCHLREETSTADPRGGQGRCGEVGFSRSQETSPECDPGGRRSCQPLLRPE